ncbi:MAG: hypothetical protein ABWY66_01855 [Xanthobacteraceae bacterium]|jgi:hypothetical protein
MKLRTFVRSAMLALPLTAACGEVRAFEAAFRGSYVCERMASTRDILRVPLELTVHGDRAEFRRPLLDLEGNRRGRVELARGVVDQSGETHLQSQWSLLGNTAHGRYRGTITPSGGTLSGTQTWTGPRGAEPVVRRCTIALVRDEAAQQR